MLPLCYILPVAMWSAYNRDLASRLRLWAHGLMVVVLVLSSIAVSIASLYFIVQQAQDVKVFP